uniref:Uncharacterized protein n=1 Tax=Arundo donax TaxID=35708 RepID=A0A0A9AEZ2_ARUDO
MDIQDRIRKKLQPVLVQMVGFFLESFGDTILCHRIN